jgi:chaperonin GroEL
VIKVGGSTEVEVKERRTALTTPCTPPALPWKKASCRAAACPALRRKALDGLKGANDDQTTRRRHRAQAITAPIKQIAENAGVDGVLVANNCSTRTTRRWASTPPPTSTKTCWPPA